MYLLHQAVSKLPSKFDVQYFRMILSLKSCIIYTEISLIKIPKVLKIC